MNLSTVRLFLEIAEAGSFSKVAARRQTAQSYLSRQITDFEAQCGAPLFRRTGRGVALTDLGESVAGRLRVWMQDTDQLMIDLRSASDKVLGEVRLGIVPSAAHPLMTRVFARLNTQHPGIRLNIVEAQGAELDSMLDSGMVDLAILFRYHRPNTREEKLLCEAHTYLISAPGDALTAGPSVSFKQLNGLQLVLPRRPSQWRNALDDTARSLGFRLQSAVEADSLIVQKELVAHTVGLYSVLGPFTIASDLQSGRLQASKLVQPDLCRHVTLAFPRQGKLSPACRMVADAIQDLVQAWGHQLTEPASL